MKQNFKRLVILGFILWILSLLLSACESKPQVISQVQTEYYFSQWPENGTFWEVQVEQGWINDSPKVKNKWGKIHLYHITI